MDVDEFIVPMKENNFLSLLKEYEPKNVSALQVLLCESLTFASHLLLRSNV